MSEVLRARSASAVAVVLLTTGCYLAHERPVPTSPVDAASIASDAHDAAAPRPDAMGATDAPFCPPGMPCDCFVGGELIWERVLYSVGDSTTVSGGGDPGQGWGADLRLEARCGGTYTVTATVIALGSRCELVSVETPVTVGDPRFGARARMPRWTANDACAAEALTRTGGETCVQIAWNATGGGTGSTMLGCFARFGPYCFGGPGCGGGGMGVGDTGDWTF